MWVQAIDGACYNADRAESVKCHYNSDTGKYEIHIRFPYGDVKVYWISGRGPMANNAYGECTRVQCALVRALARNEQFFDVNDCSEDGCEDEHE